MPVARVLLYTATIGALALIARSIFIGPISIAVSAVALVVYLGLVMCGVLFMRLGMFADVTWRGPAGAEGVALTFDDGPSPEHTPRVLDMLDEARVKATFFVIGKKADAHSDLVRAIVERGHAVGVHSYTHDRLFSLRTPRFVREDLARAVRTIERITGERPTMFRPPIGHTNPRIAREAARLDLDLVGWSIRGLDGLAGARADRVADRVIRRLGDGAIVLLHDAAERDDHEPASLAALPRILSAMRERGFAGVRVDRWVRAGEVEAETEG